MLLLLFYVLTSSGHFGSVCGYPYEKDITITSSKRANPSLVLCNARMCEFQRLFLQHSKLKMFICTKKSIHKGHRFIIHSLTWNIRNNMACKAFSNHSGVFPHLLGLCSSGFLHQLKNAYQRCSTQQHNAWHCDLSAKAWANLEAQHGKPSPLHKEFHAAFFRSINTDQTNRKASLLIFQSIMQIKPTEKLLFFRQTITVFSSKICTVHFLSPTGVQYSWSAIR